MNRNVAGAITVLSVALLVMTHLRLQPAGEARLIRNGDKISSVSDRIGWAPRYLGRQCMSPTASDGRQLEAQETFEVSTRLGQSFPSQVTLRYQPPTALPSDWPAGDWCQSLTQFVTDQSAQWGSEQGPEALSSLDWLPSQLLEARLKQALEGAGMVVQFLQVQVELPAGMAAGRPVAEVVSASAPGRPLIVLGLDGADWTMLDPLMANGDLPELKRLVEEGRGGILTSEHPPLSPLLWTTMLTGTSPLEHGIMDFTRYAPSTGIKEPITSSERRRPAIWNIATYGGRSSAIFGMWATYPAERMNGLMVSDRLFTFLHNEAAPPPNVVSPTRREQWAREALNASEQEVDFETMQAFLPWLTRDEYALHRQAADPYAHPISGLRKLLVEAKVYHRLAVEYLTAEEPELSLVFFQASDSVGHLFAPYAPPRQQTVSAADYERYHDVPRQVFRYLDSLIGEYRRLAEARGAVLMLVSDHGFTWHEGRPTQLSSFAAATAAKWHRPEGIYQLWGEGIERQPGHTGEGRLRQVTSTLVALLGLPSDANLEGPPLADVQFANDRTLRYSDYYQRVVAAAGAGSTEEELAKLRALGYISAGESTQAPADVVARGETRTAGSYNNEALLLRNEKRTPEAISAWEKALQLDPNLASALWNLSDTLFDQDQAPASLNRSDELLIRALRHGLPEGTRFVIGRAIGYQRADKLQRSLTLMINAVEARPENSELGLFLGRYRIESGDCAGALKDFRTVGERDPQNPAAFASAATAHLCLGQGEAAFAAIKRSLSLNPDQPRLQQLYQQLAKDLGRSGP